MVYPNDRKSGEEMAGTSSENSIIAALAVNTILTIVKFTAYVFTGSGTMLSEAIHSFADVMNQGLLFVGVKRSAKAPDAMFQFGYGRERFVWALMSAVGIFFMGCGFTVMHGIEALNHPQEITGIPWAIGVLLVALVLDFSVFIFAFRSLWQQKGDTPFLMFLKTEADPPEVAVLLEDGAACLGVLIAMGAIGLHVLTGELFWDAIGSILIGVLLGVVAIWLIERNLKLLTGPSIPRDDQNRVRQVLSESPLVANIKTLRSQALDNETFTVEADVTFSAAGIVNELSDDIATTYPQLSTQPDFNTFQHEYTAKVLDVVGKEIDRIEEQLTSADEAFRFVDIEIQRPEES